MLEVMVCLWCVGVALSASCLCPKVGEFFCYFLDLSQNLFWRSTQVQTRDVELLIRYGNDGCVWLSFAGCVEQKTIRKTGADRI